MRPVLIACAALLAPLAIAASPTYAATAAAPEAAKKPMTYDCSKAGNANKTACKGAAAAPKAATAATKAPAAPAMAAAAAPKKPMTYDCSKAGNANKAACNGAATAAAPAPVAVAKPSAAPAAAPVAMARPASATARPASTNGNVVAWTQKNGKVVHYDCSKAGNATKQACKQ